MKRFTLGYQTSQLGNVGDDLNPWLLQKVLPDIRFEETNRVLLCIGSILVSDRWDKYDYKLVLGSGARSKARLPHLDERWDIRFVRGPRTVAALGTAAAISDPALLLGRYVAPARNRKGIGIVPYYQSGHRFWGATAAQIGAKVISPRMPLESFIEALNNCERVFCEAMHGAIFADALRIPWRPVTFQNIKHEGDTHHFKWSDWVESVELEFDPIVQPLERMSDWPSSGILNKLSAGWDRVRCSREIASRLKHTVKDDRFTRSSEDVFEDRLDRLATMFSNVNYEFR